MTSSPDAAHPEARLTVPKNYKLLSWGAKDNWTGQGNMLTASFPEANNVWRANGKDHAELPDPTSITAFATAIYDPDDIWDVKIYKSQDSRDDEPTPMKEVAVESGYVMVGGGAHVDWKAPGNLLFASYPKKEDKMTWRAHSRQHWMPSPAKISAYAIGLSLRPEKKVTGVKVESDITQVESYSSGLPLAIAGPESGYTFAALLW